ncbi:hypothetical protein [Rhizobium sp. PL01]|uniref:hypothetical protein n=1 Tax=Rhizobium sp. PL01 TaxID=3085631 RepID=UPI002982A365|nr:hypothetical protein [Rhizobium sp. PL01]MDW5314982.1 hypothetical protein [Rhizobium sp. PL01]
MRELKLWFFRDLTDDQRLKLFSLFGLPVGEIGNVHGRQTVALDHIASKLVKLVQDETPSPPQRAVRVYPQDLTADIRDILSMMMWNTGPIAHALRDGGQDIKRKAEEEQAEVMHWLIGLALEHGSEWRAKASDRIREIQAFVKAAASEGSDV